MTSNEVLISTINETVLPETTISETPPPAVVASATAEPTRLEEFAKSATAAKASGTYNKTAGFFKRKFGAMTDDSAMREAGRNQQLLGKVQSLVGSVRQAREAASAKYNKTRVETQAVCRKHGGKLLDVLSDFVDDMKKTLFK